MRLPASRPFTTSDHPGQHEATERLRAAERIHTPHVVMGAALAHVVRNKVEAACARSDLLEDPDSQTRPFHGISQRSVTRIRISMPNPMMPIRMMPMMTMSVS